MEHATTPDPAADGPAGSAERSDLVERYREDRQALTAMLVGEFMDPILDLDLTLHQLKIVMLVASGQAASARGISDRLGLSAASVSATVEKLVSLGYLRRSADPRDRRVTVLEPTRRALRIFNRLTDRREASDGLLEELSADDLRALATGVAAVRRAAEARRAREGRAAAD